MAEFISSPAIIAANKGTDKVVALKREGQSVLDTIIKALSERMQWEISEGHPGRNNYIMSGTHDAGVGEIKVILEARFTMRRPPGG